jgi:hypothetical protein
MASAVIVAGGSTNNLRGSNVSSRFASVTSLSKS